MQSLNIGYFYCNTCSVDSLDGGATDVPILGPMEIKNYIIILFFIIPLTCRFQNLLRIENRTIISRDTASFVEEGQFLHNCYKNTLKICLFTFFFYRLEIMEIGKKLLFLLFFFILYFRPTDCTKKAREKSAIQRINRAWPQVLRMYYIVSWDPILQV